MAAGQTALFDEATLSAFECAPCIGGRRLLQRPRDGWLKLLAAVTGRVELMDAVQPGRLRDRGSMIAVELVRPGTAEPDAGPTGVTRASLDECVAVLTAGTSGKAP